MESICDATGLILDDAKGLVVHSVRVPEDVSADGGGNLGDGNLGDDDAIPVSPLGSGSGHRDGDGTAGVDRVLENLSLVDQNNTSSEAAGHPQAASSAPRTGAAGPGSNGNAAGPRPKSPGVMGGLWPFGRNNTNSANSGSAGTSGHGDDQSNAARSGATGTSARSARSGRSGRSTSSTTTILTRRVVKKCPNGDLFSGLCDAVTGEPVEGRLTDAKTGEVYEGPFVRGRRHGEGALSTRPGSAAGGGGGGDPIKFFGSFRNGDPYEGTLLTEQHTYQGRLLIPQPASRAYIFHGPKGTLLHRNGDMYQGGFSHGRYHGRGRERSSSGLNYTGQFRSGKWHGQGDLIVERRSNAKTNTNTKTNGGPNPPAPSATPDRDGSALPFNPDAFRYTYCGEWQHGEREGNGYEKIVFGKSRPGSSSQQQRQMATPSTSSAEDRLKRRTATYEGEFHRDRRHGTGILIVPDGTELRGFWKAGRPCVEPEDWEGGADDSTAGGRRSKHRNSSSSSSRHHHHQHRHKSSRHHHHHRSLASGGTRNSVVVSTSWEIDYANGDRYRGEVTLAPPPSSDGNSRVDGMKEHLHITNSLVMPVIPHGRGTMTFGATGDIYEGKFRMGKRHGFGRCISQTTGEEFDGTWIEDIPGEIGGQRTHTSRPHFESSVEAEESVSGRAEGADAVEDPDAAKDCSATDSADASDAADNGVEEIGESVLSAKDIAANSESQQPTAPAPGGILGIFGAIRRAGQPQPNLDQDAISEKEKAPGRSHDDKSQKSHDDKSVGMISAASDKTQTMTNRRSTTENNPKALGHEERSLSTESLSLINDERTLSTTDDASVASDS